MIQPQKALREVTMEWVNLMTLVEKLKYGEVRLVVQNGKPKRVEIAIKQINLDEPQEAKEKLEMIELL